MQAHLKLQCDALDRERHRINEVERETKLAEMRADDEFIANERVKAQKNRDVATIFMQEQLRQVNNKPLFLLVESTPLV